MDSFEIWYKKLTEDERWFEQAGMNHKPETFKDVALKIYTNGMTDSLEFAQTPLKFHRQHVFNKLCKITPDKVRKPWYLPKEEPKQEPLNPPLTGEARAQRLKEWMAVVEKAPILKAVAPVSSREIIENGDWRPKPPTIHEPSEIEKRVAYLEHLEMMRRCRSKVYTDAFPEATADEIEAYIQTFSHLDNPLNL